MSFTFCRLANALRCLLDVADVVGPPAALRCNSYLHNGAQSQVLRS